MARKQLRFSTVVADPPWPYASAGPIGTGGGVDASAHYSLMGLDEIKSLSFPVADNAHLYLWTTNAFMVEAHEVARAWGFQPKTICTWGKVKSDGTPSCKTGYYFRGATEHVVFAVRGSLRLNTDKGLPTLWLWPRLPHSVKPDQFYDLVKQVSPGPRLEMFARQKRDGFMAWGNEVECDVEVGRGYGRRW